MIFHASIATRQPERVARAIAKLWNGAVFPLPPYPGSFIAFAGDDRASAVEVYPLGHELVPADGDADVRMAVNPQPRGLGSTHLAIATDLTEEQVRAIAGREGWMVKKCDRGGRYHAIEFWIENTVLLEVLTAEMQREYHASMTLGSWQEHYTPPDASDRYLRRLRA